VPSPTDGYAAIPLVRRILVAPRSHKLWRTYSRHRTGHSEHLSGAAPSRQMIMRPRPAKMRYATNCDGHVPETDHRFEVVLQGVRFPVDRWGKRANLKGSMSNVAASSVSIMSSPNTLVARQTSRNALCCSGFTHMASKSREIARLFGGQFRSKR
jgi:hypothetical protein